MFEDATFHSRGILPSKTPQWMLFTLAINLTFVTTAIVLPLICPEGLPAGLIQRELAAPPAALETRPEQHVSQPSANPTSAPINPYILPVIPSKDRDSGPPATNIGDLSPTSSVGTPGSTEPVSILFPSNPPPIAHPAQPSRIIISGGVTEGLLIHRTTPVYPIIARTAGISGTVTLAATISKTGVIENLRVLSGHPMLRQAALDSVQNWRYRPYLLNNQPVEVETTINVVFSMNGH